VPGSFIEALTRVLAQVASDPGLVAEALLLPSESLLAEEMDVVEPDAIHAVRTQVLRNIAECLQEPLHDVYRKYQMTGAYSPDADSAGRRALRNLALAYLMETQTPQARALVYAHFNTADNMTDSYAALAILADLDCPERTQALEAFYARWQGEPLVVDKWLRVQAVSRLPDTLARVTQLLAHPAFSLQNPNKVYALIGGFSQGNHVRFHAADGSGYAFLTDQVIALDPLNPQVAARLARGFDRWRKLDAGRQVYARSALERIRNTAGLSKDVSEIVTKGLQ
jgi:aminopeptidase N